MSTVTYASGDVISSVAPMRRLSRRGLLAAGLLAAPLAWLGLREAEEETPTVTLDWLARHRSLADAASRARSYGKPLLVTDSRSGRDAVADLWLSGDLLAQVAAALCEFCWYDVDAVSELVGSSPDAVKAPMVLLETCGKRLRVQPLHVRPYYLPVVPKGRGRSFCGNVKFDRGWQADQETDRRRSMLQRLRELRTATDRRERMQQLTRLLLKYVAPDFRALQKRAGDCAAALPLGQRQKVKRDLAEGNPLSDSPAQVAAMIALAATTTSIERKRRLFYRMLAEAGDVTRQRDALTLLFAEEPSAIPDVVELLEGPEAEDEEP